jgi:hypothetical protein
MRWRRSTPHKSEPQQVKAEQARNAEVRAAARLVADQLAIFVAAAQMLLEKKYLVEPPAPEFLYGAWDQNKAVLAREIDDESFDAVRQAVYQGSNFPWRQYMANASPAEPPSDRSAAFKSLYADISRGMEALRPYMVNARKIGGQ